MLKKVTIKNVKNIKELTFDIPDPGVYLLTGSNGSGKTTLLACLQRIGQAQAFAYHFSSSNRSTSLDSFHDAQISYTLDSREVVYTYGGERWVPRPRSQNKLLRELGYSAVFYIGATADRITPRQEDFIPRGISPAHEKIRATANRIFDTNKFDLLKTINLTRGSGNPAFVMQIPSSNPPEYYSERNFSLGELCVLKLLRYLINCDNSSLVLIDELELALHPKAQIELYRHLSEIAPEKNLTIIFSTHSASLLKFVNHKQILFLESNLGIVSSQKGCYPTYALGHLSYDEERAPDVIFYVEDDAAVAVIDVFIRKCIAYKYSNNNMLFPTVHVIPIGGFLNVIRFLGRSDAILPPSTKSFALLDKDVKDESLKEFRRNNNHKILQEFQKNEKRIGYLPWAPEVGLIDFFLNSRSDAQRTVRDIFSNNMLSINYQDIKAPPNNNRDACKSLLSEISNHLSSQLPNKESEDVRKQLFSAFAEWYFNKNKSSIMNDICSLLWNSRDTRSSSPPR